LVTESKLSSPLSQKQTLIWALIQKGQSVTGIAQKLKTTRQFVNQTKLAAEARLSSTLLDVAQANHIHVVKMYLDEGILLGYHPGLNRRAIITYSTKNGIKVWYWFDNPEEVTDQEFLRQTRAYILEFAGERGMKIEDANQMHPSKLAHLVFSKVIPELKS
jgi:hypothetical protein